MIVVMTSDDQYGNLLYIFEMFFTFMIIVYPPTHAVGVGARVHIFWLPIRLANCVSNDTGYFTLRSNVAR